MVCRKDSKKHEGRIDRGGHEGRREREEKLDYPVKPDNDMQDPMGCLSSSNTVGYGRNESICCL